MFGQSKNRKLTGSSIENVRRARLVPRGTAVDPAPGFIRHKKFRGNSDTFNRRRGDRLT